MRRFHESLLCVDLAGQRNLSAYCQGLVFFAAICLVKLPHLSGMRIDLRQHAERNSTEPCRDPDILRNDSDARQRRDESCGMNSQILNGLPSNVPADAQLHIEE
jgi:hypothetical protein